MDENLFKKYIEIIFEDCPTKEYKNVFWILRNKYSKGKTTFGKYTIRYILKNFSKQTLDYAYNSKESMVNYLQVNKKCLPFEHSPLTKNFVGTKSTKKIEMLLQIVNDWNDIKTKKPYVFLNKLTNDFDELYYEANESFVKNVIKYNNSLSPWDKKQGEEIKILDNNVVCIKCYEEESIEILTKLKERCYEFYDTSRMKKNNLKLKKLVDFSKKLDSIKMETLKNLFTMSSILLIYGAAGTGKTTLIKCISKLYENENQLFITKTHAALENLRSKINDNGKYIFNTIKNVKKYEIDSANIIFIDECSTIDNDEILKFLSKTNMNQKLVFAGDTYQIESIDFGNWFKYAKMILQKDYINVELNSNFRAKSENLSKLWNGVRKKVNVITEMLSMDGPFSKEISIDILSKKNDEEIILCLNYDGKFGLNNINMILQNANQNPPVKCNDWTFKIDDPIIFSENNYSPLLYNNLKGKIVDIIVNNGYTTYVIDIDIYLENNSNMDQFKYISNPSSDKTRISIDIFEFYDEIESFSMPFQLAYAISIHKAQGLEYDSVKIIIPSNNDEMITHSIFYTAITRAKKNLTIFWSPETMNKVIKNIYKEDTRQQFSYDILNKQLQDC